MRVASSKDRPCNGSTDRYVGCHGHCELETLWLEAQKAKQDMVQEAMRSNKIVDDFRTAMIRKTRRKSK